MIKLLNGDCIEKLKEIKDNSVDSIVTDPPYEIGFMGKSWDNTGIANNVEMWKECLRVLKPGGHLLAFSGTRTYHRMACAIEDAGFEVRDMMCWAYGQGFPKSLNVFKQLQKKCKCGNMDIYENRIKQVGKNREQETEYFLRFMQEANLSQTISIEKERGEVLQSGLSEQNTHETMQGKESKESIENGKESSVERWNNLQETEGELQGGDLCEMSEGISNNGEERRIHNEAQVSNGSTLKQTTDENGGGASHRPQSEQQQYKQPCAFCKQWGTQATRTLGVGSALKPSIEPICFSRKPLEKGLTIAENCLKWGTGGINIDESRVEYQGEEDFSNTLKSNTGNVAGGIFKCSSKSMSKEEVITQLGRFPANLIHDGSEEVRECFPETKSGKNKQEKGTGGIWSKSSGLPCGPEYDDSGNASRFFKSIIYQAKASKSERNKGCEEPPLGEPPASARSKPAEGRENALGKPRQNNHPTVKPIALMEYLIKMVTPKGGVVLDMFMGSGSTGIGAIQEGFGFIGIEKEPDYFKIAEKRINSIKIQEKLL